MAGPVAAVAAAAAALRAAFPDRKAEKVTVHLHSGKVDLPGAATIHIYQAGQALMAGVGFADPAVYDGLKQHLLSAAAAGTQLSAVADVCTLCELSLIHI